MEEALVSIVTPAYRAEDFIINTIQSVQNQDYACWEMFVVDDCSPDETRARVKAIGDSDSRVVLVEQPVNSGPAAARNVALERATGRYIAFLDSDDLWMPGKIATQLNFMQQQQAAISYTEYRRISENGKRIGRHVSVPGSLTYTDLLCNTAIVTSSVMVDRDITGPFSMPDAPYDDYALWLSILRAGHVACGVKRDLVRYRIVADSVSRRKRASATRVWRTYREVESLGVLRSVWSFTNYAARAWLKYRVF